VYLPRALHTVETWPGVVETSARGIATLIKGAEGVCVAVSASGLLKTLGLPFNPMVASQIKYILNLLDRAGLVSHKYYKRVGSAKRRKVVYVFCREPTPYTDGYFNPERAKEFWGMIRELPIDEAVDELSWLIMRLEHSPSPSTPKPSPSPIPIPVWM
jgi:hypothetical protein